MARLKIGEMLLKAGLVDQLQLNAALAHQRQWGGRLGSVCVEMGFVDEDVLWKGLARQTGLVRAELSQLAISPAVLQRVPVDMCEKHCIIPVGYRDDTKTLTLATSDPGNTAALDEVQFASRLKTAYALAPDTEIKWAIGRHYRGDTSPCPALRKKRELGTDVDTEDIKILDRVGNTVVKAASEIRPVATTPPPAPAGFGSPGTNAFADVPHSRLTGLDGELSPEAQALKAEVEKGNRFLKGIIELCVRHGIFTEQEYLERLRRA